MPNWLANTWSPFGCDAFNGGDDGPESSYDDAQILAWAASNAYQLIVITYDETGVILSADIKWPDGSSGTYTRTSKSAEWNMVDAYMVTHDTSGATVSQPLMTRDAYGNVTLKPELVVSGYSPAVPGNNTISVSVKFPTVAAFQASIVTAQTVLLEVDANGNSGWFVLDPTNTDSDDGVNVLIDAAGTHYRRVSAV